MRHQNPLLIPNSIVVDNENDDDQQSTLSTEARLQPINGGRRMTKSHHSSREKMAIGKRKEKNRSSSSTSDVSSSSKKSFFSFRSYGSRNSKATTSSRSSFHGKMREAKKLQKEKYLATKSGGQKQPLRTQTKRSKRKPVSRNGRPPLPRSPPRRQLQQQQPPTIKRVDTPDETVGNFVPHRKLNVSAQTKSLLQRFDEERDNRTVETADSDIFTITSRLTRARDRKRADATVANPRNDGCFSGYDSLINIFFSWNETLCGGTPPSDKRNVRSKEERLPSDEQHLPAVPEEASVKDGLDKLNRVAMHETSSGYAESRDDVDIESVEHVGFF